MAHADSKIDNKIICREIPNSKTVRNFIQKRLREWIRVHGLDETNTHYQVILESRRRWPSLFLPDRSTGCFKFLRRIPGSRCCRRIPSSPCRKVGRNLGGFRPSPDPPEDPESYDSRTGARNGLTPSSPHQTTLIERVAPVHYPPKFASRRGGSLQVNGGFYFGALYGYKRRQKIMRLLVVEDQKKMAGFIKKGLTEAGYVVDLAETGATAETLVGENPYDLVILDVGLPDQSGLDTARHLRQDGYAGPILMLTALSGTKDKVHGLDAGADDYLTKPFEFDELSARVRALLRRQGSGATSGTQSVLNFSDLELNLVSRKVTREGKEINLTPKEFSLLSYFLRNPNRPISRTTISEHVWDIRFDSDSNVIDVYINMLRKKVDHPFAKKLIHTVVGVGYVLRED